MRPESNNGLIKSIVEWLNPFLRTKKARKSTHRTLDKKESAVSLCFIKKGKSQSSHCHALRWIIVASNRNLNPKHVAYDFEKGLINAFKSQFVESEAN